MIKREEVKEPIHSLECPKCNKVSPYVYETDFKNSDDETEQLEVFHCSECGEWAIAEFGAIYSKKLKIIKQVSWKEIKMHELG